MSKMRLRSLLMVKSVRFWLRVLNLKTVNNAHAPVRRTTETQLYRKNNTKKESKSTTKTEEKKKEAQQYEWITICVA